MHQRHYNNIGKYTSFLEKSVRKGKDVGEKGYDDTHLANRYCFEITLSRKNAMRASTT